MLHRIPRYAGFCRPSLAAVLVILLAGCGGMAGNASLGPDPGGGFYCPHNAFEGCVGR